MHAATLKAAPPGVAPIKLPGAPDTAPTTPPQDSGGLSWFDIETTDAGQAASMQRRWMPIEYDQVDCGEFHGRFQQLGFQNTLVVAERQNRTVLKRQYFPPDTCTVSLIRSASGQGRCGLDKLVGRSVGYMPGDKDYDLMLPASEIVFFRIQQDRLLRAAATLGYGLPGEGREMLFLEGLNSSYLDSVADTLMAIQQSPASHAFATLDHSRLDDMVLDHIIGVLLDSAAPPKRMLPVNAHRITKAALAFIDDNPDDPLTVMNLCEALKVSRTYLQRSFLQIYGISPLAYLRMRRLNDARRALKIGQGTDVTVAQIAMRNGFFHFARFAQDYFQQFGELPSSTLGRPRAGRSLE